MFLTLLFVPTQSERNEASRVIFMGWPGQHEMEDADPDQQPQPSTPGAAAAAAGSAFSGALGGTIGASGQPLPMPLNVPLELPLGKGAAAAAATAKPPQALEERMRSQNGRQLGCDANSSAVTRVACLD